MKTELRFLFLQLILVSVIKSNVEDISSSAESAGFKIVNNINSYKFLSYSEEYNLKLESSLCLSSKSDAVYRSIGYPFLYVFNVGSIGNGLSPKPYESRCPDGKFFAKFTSKRVAVEVNNFGDGLGNEDLLTVVLNCREPNQVLFVNNARVCHSHLEYRVYYLRSLNVSCRTVDTDLVMIYLRPFAYNLQPEIRLCSSSGRDRVEFQYDNRCYLPADCESVSGFILAQTGSYTCVAKSCTPSQPVKVQHNDLTVEVTTDDKNQLVQANFSCKHGEVILDKLKEYISYKDIQPGKSVHLKWTWDYVNKSDRIEEEFYIHTFNGTTWNKQSGWFFQVANDGGWPVECASRLNESSWLVGVTVGSVVFCVILLSVIIAVTLHRRRRMKRVERPTRHERNEYALAEVDNNISSVEN